MCRTASWRSQRDYPPSQLIEAANFLNAHFAGLSFDEVRRRLKDELARVARRHDQLMQRGDRGGQRGRRADDTVI